MKTLPALLCVAAFLSGPCADAALLVYEGYNGYTPGAMGSTGPTGNANPNGNTIGLDKAVAYAPTSVSNYTFTDTPMTFGSLPVSGGSLTFNGGTAIIAGELDFTNPAAGSTLWNGYLIRITTRGAGSGDGFHSRVATNTGTGGVHFQSYPDNRGTTTTEAGIRYVDTQQLAGASLTLDVDYFILSSFTNAGTTLSAGTPGVATMYAFNLAQFGNLMAATNREDYLAALSQGTGDTNATIKVSQSVTSGSQTFTNTQFVHFVSVNMSGSVDEMRWATDLESLLTIPEPGTATLGLLAFASAAFRRKRHAAGD